MIDSCNSSYVIYMINNVLYSGSFVTSDVVSVKIHHDHSAVVRDEFQDVVRDITGRIAQGEGAWMGENNRRSRDVQSRLGSVHRSMGEIHYHPQTVHFLYDALAEVRKTVLGLRVGPCSPRGVAGMGYS